MTMNDDRKKLAVSIRERAENLYLTRQYLCSETILLTLNRGLGGPLSDDQAVGLSAGLAVGMGGSGCLCGAVGGATLAIGLLLGSAGAHGKRREIRQTTGEFHAWFKDKYGSACCRVLSKKVKDDPKAHFRQCAAITGTAAEQASLMILSKRPDLLLAPDQRYLNGRDSKVYGRLKWALNLFCR